MGVKQLEKARGTTDHTIPEGGRDSGADTHWVVDLCFYGV
jgi:hypothetical protein